MASTENSTRWPGVVATATDATVTQLFELAQEVTQDLPYLLLMTQAKAKQPCPWTWSAKVHNTFLVMVVAF